MRLPVDTSAVNVISAGPPELAIDFDRKQLNTDVKCVAINQVHLFVVGDRSGLSFSASRVEAAPAKASA